MSDVSKLLKDKGCSLTGQRQAILGILSGGKLFTAQEIKKYLQKKKIKIDLATIYRTLELFVKLGLAEKTQFEEKIARYEIIPGHKHHHHLVCQKCGTVEDVSVNEEKLIWQVESHSKFLVKKHTLEFFGLCLKCR